MSQKSAYPVSEVSPVDLAGVSGLPTLASHNSQPQSADSQPTPPHNPKPYA